MTGARIHFISQDLDFTLPDEDFTRQWLINCAKSEQCFIGTLNYIFCSDEYLIEKNNQYLNHDTYTDIITFDYSDGGVLGGDVLISIDRVKENASELSIEFDTELSRVMAHGLLHLAGYGDKSDEEATLMREKEGECLQRLKSI